MEGLKYDGGKLPMNLLPFDALEAVARVLGHGAVKYGPNNWQALENAEERYEAALIRHLSAHKKGEVTDPESGLSHLAHMACNALFLLHFQEEKAKHTS
jgi:hypothetical protein